MEKPIAQIFAVFRAETYLVEAGTGQNIKSYEGRRKSSRPNHERGVLGKILFAIFERIHLSTLDI